MTGDDYQTAARRYLESVLKQTGLTATEVARRVGLASTTLTRFLNDPDWKHTLSARTLAKIEQHTGHALPAELGGAILNKNSPSLRYGEAQRADSPIPPSGGRDLPVQGSISGNGDDVIVFNGPVSAYVERPWFLLGNPRAYAVYMHGESMEPAYAVGHLLYVNPAIPPAPGQDVLVQTKDGRGLVKRLKRRGPGKVVLEQFNPAKEITLAQEQITAMHLIVAALKVPA